MRPLKVPFPSVRNVVSTFLLILLIHQFVVHASISTTTMTQERIEEDATPDTLSWSKSRSMAVYDDGFFEIDNNRKVNKVNMLGKTQSIDQVKSHATDVQCSADGNVLAVETHDGITVLNEFGKKELVTLSNQTTPVVSGDGQIIFTTTREPYLSGSLFFILICALFAATPDKYPFFITLVLVIWRLLMKKTFRAYSSDGKLLLEHESRGLSLSTSSNSKNMIIIEGTNIFEKVKNKKDNSIKAGVLDELRASYRLRSPVQNFRLDPRSRRVIPTNLSLQESSKNKHYTLYSDGLTQAQVYNTSGSKDDNVRYFELPKNAIVIKVTDEGSIWYLFKKAIWRRKWSGECEEKFKIFGRLRKSSDGSTLMDAIPDHKNSQNILKFYHI